LSLANTTSEDDIPAIFEFFQAFMELVFVWMAEFSQYVPEYEASIQTTEMVNTCKRASIARLGKELLDSLAKIFALYPRC